MSEARNSVVASHTVSGPRLRGPTVVHQRFACGKALRSNGLARATLHLNRTVTAYNLQRLVYLKEARVEAF